MSQKTFRNQTPMRPQYQALIALDGGLTFLGRYSKFRSHEAIDITNTEVPMLVKPFTRFDWDSWAGAEPTGKGAPAIGYATPDPTDKPSDAMEAIVIVDGRGISVTYLDHTADLVVTYELQVTFAAGLAIAAALQEDSLSLTQLRALGFTGEPDSLR